MLRLEGVMLAQDGFRLAADWSVEAGQRIALIGPSGAGKSTLLLALAGFLAPVAGRILWNGADLAPLPPGDRPVSILFQDQNLFPHLTIAQNLGLGLSARLKLASADLSRIETALDRVGLGHLGSRRPAELSGGQQSRAALARALLRARPILLLDEPFAALGPALKFDMLDLVAEIADETGTLVLLVTHNPADARRFSQETVFVADGIAAGPVPTAMLFDDPPPGLRDYFGG